MTSALTPSQLFVQRTGVILAKAMLSSIPLASVAFDVGQAAIEFGNARVSGSFINELAARIERLDELQKAAIKNSDTYEIAAHGVLRSLLSETNERVAQVLGRACVELPLAEFQPAYEQQCARILLEATEPFLHALQTNERFHNGSLSPSEIATFKDMIADKGQQLAALLYASMPLPYWQTIMARLMQLGLIEHIEDHGSFSDNRPRVDTGLATDFGKAFIDLCFENVSIPQFGRFASES